MRQTYPRWELWIVDDGSTDDTSEAGAGLAAADARIQRLRQANGGPGAARDTGRRAARGEFLQYLDSDDLLYPRKLELQVAALNADPGAGIAYCRCVESDSEGRPSDLPLRPSDRLLASMFPTFLACRWWNTIVPLYRAELCERAGAWLPLFQEEDWEYYARNASLAPGLRFVDEPLAEHRDRSTNRLSRSGLPELRRLQDRAIAHERILDHAVRAGVGREVPEMQRFARELFLLGRQCGAVGLVQPSKALFRLARAASTPERAAGMDFRLYRAAAAIVGWRGVAVLASWMERLRPRPRG